MTKINTPAQEIWRHLACWASRLRMLGPVPALIEPHNKRADGSEDYECENKEEIDHWKFLRHAHLNL